MKLLLSSFLLVVPACVSAMQLQSLVPSSHQFVTYKEFMASSEKEDMRRRLKADAHHIR